MRAKYFITAVANGWIVWKGKKQPVMPEDEDYAKLHVFNSLKTLLSYLNQELKEVPRRTDQTEVLNAGSVESPNIKSISQ